MKRNLTILILTISINGICQTGAIPTVIRAQNTLDAIAQQGGVGMSSILYGVPMRPGTVIGDYYLDKKWNVTSILLNTTDKLLQGYLTRLDVKNHQLEIKLDDDVKVLNSKLIKSIVWIDSINSQPRFFVNASGYTIEGTKLSGLIEVIEDGKLPLFKYTSVYIKKADYNPAFDIGSRDDKIIKDEAYYFPIKDELFEFKNKKSVDLAFGSKAKAMNDFIKQKKLTLSKQNDLIAIFSYYNSIIE